MEEKTPFLSIVVPVLNREKTILTCLKSIQAQTYKDFEVLIVDGKSTDNTQKIVKEFSKEDSRFILIINNINSGVTPHNVSIGMKAARGQYIGYVDSDDYIDPRYYEALVNNALKYDADVSQVQFNNGHNDKDQIITFYPSKKMKRVRNNIFRYTKTYSRCLRIHKTYLRDYILKYYTQYNDIVWEDTIFTFALVIKAQSYVTSSLGFYYYNFSRNNDFPKRIYNEEYFKRLEILCNINERIFKDNPKIYSRQQYCVPMAPICECILEENKNEISKNTKIWMKQIMKHYRWRKDESTSKFLILKLKYLFKKI